MTFNVMRLSILGVLWSLICPTGFAQDILESALDRLQPEPQVEWGVQNFTVRDGLPTDFLHQVLEDRSRIFVAEYMGRADTL